MCVCVHITVWCLDSETSIYKCHDETKDKNFVLELSWIGEGSYGHCIVSVLVLFVTLLPHLHAVPSHQYPPGVCSVTTYLHWCLSQVQMAAMRLSQMRSIRRLRTVPRQP